MNPNPRPGFQTEVAIDPEIRAILLPGGALRFLTLNNLGADIVTEHTTTWPDLAIGLYERLTGMHAVIAYEFVDMHVKIPSGTGPQAEHAEWILSGTIKIRTTESGPLPN